MTDLLSRRSELSAAKLRLLEERLRGVAKTSSEKDVIRARPRRDRVPLSFAQQRLWFLDQLEPGNPFYNIPDAVRLTGRLNLDAFESVFNEIVRRHEALRTRFVTEGGESAQVIDEWKPRTLEIKDLTRLSREERERQAHRMAREEARTGFDLWRGPLLRVKVLKLEREEHVALFTMHHIVS
ncbi:MAG: condensation domain-containing protein, partial [Blastocatellia bacterium]